MVILGSTGSIGTNALKLCQDKGIRVEAISCNKNVDLLNKQILEFKPKLVCLTDESLKNKIVANGAKIFSGTSGLDDMLSECKSKKVLNALVGFAGLKPSLKIQELGKTLALANKESLVNAGKFLNTKNILPIDSEHFGLKFLLQNRTTPNRLILTASGGAFYKTALKNLKNVSAKDALKHPNWQMGAKITIDSATMSNKLFEVLEAFWLFNIKNIDALIEPTSSIHAIVEFIDGSSTTHISKTDMRLAIAHAIFENVNFCALENESLLELRPIKFHKISHKKYPIFSLKDELLKNPDLGVVINSANDTMVELFLKGKCNFLDISKIVLSAFKKFNNIKISNIDDIFMAYSQTKDYVLREMNAKI